MPVILNNHRKSFFILEISNSAAASLSEAHLSVKEWGWAPKPLLQATSRVRPFNFASSSPWPSPFLLSPR